MLKQCIFLIIINCFSLIAQADQIKAFGNYEVKYSVINSLLVDPELATRHGIMRSKDLAVVNIAIHNPQHKTAQTKTHKAIIKGRSSDLIHSADLDFTEINEGDSTYYMAELRFHHKELRTFSIKIQPDPKIAPYTLKFYKTLYSEK